MENTCFLYLFVIDFCAITLSFIESWAHPIVVVVVEVVVVQVAVVHVPHVVSVVSRTKPIIQARTKTLSSWDLLSITLY